MTEKAKEKAKLNREWQQISAVSLQSLVRSLDRTRGQVL